MLKGRGRDPRAGSSPVPLHLNRPLPQQPAARTLAAVPSSSKLTLRTPTAQRAPLAKPEPDYEVVEFPTEQYVNAKLQPPPPPPPRPPTGHPAEAGASCGLCGGGGARVRCAECGRRALCASCDDMYHRHPKRRHHHRQALTMTQLRDERPPLPPKATPPVPPPRRHKISGSSPSPRPPSDMRSATLGPMMHAQNAMIANNQMSTLPSQHAVPAHLTKILGSMPYLPNAHQPHHPAPMQPQTNAMGPLASGWGRPRGSLPGFNVPPNMQMPVESWESPVSVPAQAMGWGRPLRRGASVLELGGGPAMVQGGGCGGCAGAGPWRYGSCASLDHPWAAWQPPPCCGHVPPPQHHAHAPYTPQPYRRADSRAVSRAGSRTCSRAASPAMSARSRTSRRTKHRTPSPPPLPSSDADSESESDHDRRPAQSHPSDRYPEKPKVIEPTVEDSLGPAPSPPNASWQCEHCTFVNEPGVRVCVVCCRTPTAAPKIVENARNSDEQAKNNPKVAVNNIEQTRRDDAQSIAVSAKAVADTARSIARLDVNDSQSNASVSPVRTNGTAQVQNGVTRTKSVLKKERVSTGCGPSPPREEPFRRTTNHLATPTREANVEPSRHDMGVGSSPPKEIRRVSVPTEEHKPVRASSYRETIPEPPTRHSISVGPSPPRETMQRSPSVQKKTAATSPPSDRRSERRTPASSRSNVSNTGTSPPPQSISTQTYEVPTTWERAPSAARSRRRFRDRDERRERSHSRHSLSSDTRECERSTRTGEAVLDWRGEGRAVTAARTESERSTRTGGGGGGGVSGRWEWREGRDSSPGGEWSGSERRRPARLARRASHLDLRRGRAPVDRRASFYGSEAASPEPTRAVSLEALANQSAAAERGLELARLMGDAERLGFSAAEVQAALAQSPASPLAWLRERWPSLCAGVRAAAARLEPRALVSDLEARAALARHRGAMWPAVTDCVERHRRQAAAPAAVTGRVWGSPAGAEDDAAPPRRAEGSSDEFEGPAPAELRDDDWMYLPLDANPKPRTDPFRDAWGLPLEGRVYGSARNAAHAVDLLVQAAAPPIPNDSLFETLIPTEEIGDGYGGVKPPTLDFIQSENDFIEAYNALTKSTPLPVQEHELAPETGPKRDTYDVLGDDSHLYINHVIDANANNNITAEPPSNRFKEITNQNNHQQSNIEPQQIEKFEAIPNNVQSKQLPSTSNTEKLEKSRETINNITDHSNATLAVAHGQAKESLLDNYVVINKKTATQPQIDVLKKEKTEIEATVESRSENNVPIRQIEEKSNNLNEIVDNTQRLIQQMKEEINSDINSIDSRNISQSEADSSSNESDISTEHESSYSESDERDTENLSSNDESSSTDSNTEHQTKRRPTIIQRTSSEENDHFEEAMDHIEDQIEDFKNTNIEILDSIARSLQEEHSMSVEMDKPKVINDIGEDHNNNLFVEVNSFEEIYAELNTSSIKLDKSPTTHVNVKNDNTERVSIVNSEYKSEDDHFEEPLEEDNNIAKFEIVISSFHSSPSIRPLISENNQYILNAVLDTIEEGLTITNKIIQNDDSDGGNSQSETTDTEENVDDDDTVKVSINNSHQSPAEVTTINIDNDVEPLTEVNEVIEEPNNIVATEENTTPAESNNHILTDSVESIDVGVENIVVDVENTESTEKVIVTENIVNNEEPEARFPQIDTNQSSEKTASKPAKDNLTNRTINSIKSNIPKFIKLVQSNKQKQEKSSPKVISSKVPVRRTSLKQYPAPAPPKSHFGNIQSGHVKQLQTRLFNDKFPKTVVNIPTAVDVKPSTSTLNKKKPAPPPPSTQPNQASTSITSSPPKEKKANFFRESCRTEDEWTESDSEESQIQVVRTSDEPERAPSPPPPLTLRRVSGQIIDLAKVQLPEGSPERQARMLLAQGATETWEQARLAVELAARGTAAPAALLAALECADLPAALAYLQQDCELCAARLPEHEMVSMLRCTHRCCRECARHYFTVQITERSIADCVCPYCKVPELESMPEDEWMEYFAHLDILLKTLLDIEVHELFQRKLRDRTLARDPNFRWCVECSSGFFVHPKQKKIRCPECRSISCAKCQKPWSANHEGLSCEQYAAWLEDNDPERSAAAVQQHLRENGLECPRCRFKYSLSRGGCMHFTCTQCKYEFCYGCGKTFTMGARCGLSEYCAKLGLHAHHPRNCLFYLRDKEPHQLQTLLQMNNVPYETEAPEGSPGRCPIQLQRETPAGLVDGSCGSDVPPNHAGLCKNHYLEYLSRLVRARGVDPLPLLDAADLETLVRRAALRLPPRPYGSLEGVFRHALQQHGGRPSVSAPARRPHYVEYLAGLARALDPIPVMDVSELVAELRRRALPLPERGPWDSDPIYAGMCAEIVKEKIPLD